jgi:hypothetical protein
MELGARSARRARRAAATVRCGSSAQRSRTAHQLDRPAPTKSARIPERRTTRSCSSMRQSRVLLHKRPPTDCSPVCGSFPRLKAAAGFRARAHRRKLSLDRAKRSRTRSRTSAPTNAVHYGQLRAKQKRRERGASLGNISDWLPTRSRRRCAGCGPGSASIWPKR